jgi:hypothetical protein
VLGKFLRTWRDCEKTLAQYSDKTPIRSSSVDVHDPADVSLAPPRQLISIKNTLHIEAKLEMIALVVAIFSEVCRY